MNWRFEIEGRLCLEVSYKPGVREGRGRRTFPFSKGCRHHGFVIMRAKGQHTTPRVYTNPHLRYF
jgi:hypothetical protein